jgi:lipoprotein-releasing system permease protein
VYRAFLAKRYILSRRVNLISIGGVMLGVAVLITVTAVMDGFQERVKSIVRGNLSHLAVMPLDRQPPDASALAQRLQRDEPRIVGIAPVVTAPMGYPFNDRRRGALSVQDQSAHFVSAVGLDWELEKRIEEALVRRHGEQAREGSLQLVHQADPKDPFDSPRQRESARWYHSVLVSKSFLRTYHGIPLKDAAGQRAFLDRDVQLITIVEGVDKQGQPTVTPSSRTFVITGIYDGGDQAEDRTRFLFRRQDLVEICGLKSPWHELRVWIEDYEQAEHVKADLQRLHPELSIETWEDQRADFLRAVKTEKALLVIVLSFIVLLGGFIILATLTLIVVEKTRDIGVLAALGATRSGILSIFLRNGLIVGIIGAVLGLGLGALLVDNLDNIKDWFAARGIHLFPPDIYLFTEVPTVWDWPTVGVILAGSVAVAFLAGLLPALRAARLDPIVALRHE